MLPIPADIFTEPSKVSPDGIANLGPLRGLAGGWQAQRGVDVNPKAEGPEQRIFQEHNLMLPIDPQTNGPQIFYGLRYHIHINTLEDDITFHDQVGYWLWEPNSGLILQSVTIPRGQALLAAGNGKPGDKKISVSAKRGDTAYGICSNEFLEQAFRTDSYRCDITFNDDGTWTYLIETELMVKGSDKPFLHHDTNTMKLVAAPQLNPWALKLKSQGAKA
jgi:hypothetical protein